MSPFDSLWLIPVLPLIGATVNGVLGKRLSKNAIGILAAGSVGLSFLISLRAFTAMLALPQTELPILRDYFTWIQAAAFQAQFGLMLDHLSGLMILIVTGVGFLIHIYSIGYMNHEEGFYRYFSYLNLFVFFMLVLVLANNYLLMFVGWEGVGLCSYLLIGFWFSKKSAADAGKKAFIVNRVGDFGFILATMLIYWTFGRVDFQSVFSRLENASQFPVEPLGTVGVLTTICLLLFVGAAGKSAQFPLYVWLPDAMEGPTPVSALIHAATMVTAGVYMVARSGSLYNHAPGALFVVAIVGVFTAIYAASIGLVQTDIKKVLAYSTVSQLGYMFLGCGAGVYAAGVFHLMTHAFFKALLFLGAGSVIHGMGGIQDIRKMGGLRHHMPWTHRTFLVGTLAIAGVPGLAGFFSKDAVLEAAWSHAAYGKLLWAIGVIAAGFTSFYMFRLLILTFYGKPRYSDHDVHHVHESHALMIVPLIVLAIFSIVAGYIDIPHFLAPASLEAESEAAASRSTELLLMAASTSVALLGFALAYLFYVAKPELPERIASRAHAMYSILVNKYYVDELYDAIIVWPIVQTSREFLWKVVDTLMIDGAVNSVGRMVRGTAGGLKHMQSGYVRTYAGWILFGGVLVVAWFLR
ncbi:MAG TPA: NADH-quinone oxidoreductase subunit L [Terriglobia bacterium]|nr:NADH-quinone oxidoreductase subunit L [Terriglobia bacterium]